VIEDVQLDSDVNAQSDPICSSAGCTQYKHKKKGLGYDIDYFVPNFGADHLINQNHESLDWAEKSLGHHWVWKDDKDEKVVEYHHKAMDPDIVDSLKNMKDQEGIHGPWNMPPDDYFQVQVDGKADANSDPICSSAGCSQYKHKKKPRGYDINYPVPNFGVDRDILDNHNSLEVAEGALGHKLIMGTEASKAKWHNVAKDTDYNFAPKLDQDMVITAKNLADSQTNLGHKWVIDDLQLDSDVVSDPICSSAGCS
jgi:TfoX/Sxy family transcriptional regulator of competence genes